MNDVTPDEIYEARTLLEATGRYRTIELLEPVEVFNPLTPPPGKRLPRLLVLDVETTGMKHEKEKIIEIGLALVEFSGGKLGRVIETYNGFEDPGRPLSDKIKQVTGIDDAMLAGHAFEDAKIESLISRSDLVLAHNAKFDRQFAERRFPAFEKKWWACSFQDGPWEDLAIGSSKLEYLCYKVGGFYYNAHRALTDVQATLKLLATPLEDGTVLGHIVRRAREPSFTVWADGAPFEKKDALSEAGYHWSPADNGRGELKSWFKEGLSQTQRDEEIEFLKTLYGGRCTVDRHMGVTRYSGRINSADRETVSLSERRLAPAA